MLLACQKIFWKLRCASAHKSDNDKVLEYVFLKLEHTTFTSMYMRLQVHILINN